MRRSTFPVFALLLFLLTACNPSKHLSDGEYMLNKNTVKVVDKKGVEFDDLYYMVRPITNKKILDVFPFRAWQYSHNQPKVDSAGNVIKDTKFMQKQRAKGEETILLDTTMIPYSINQIYTAMKNWGYFDAKAWDTIIYKGPDKRHPHRHMAEVTYFVEAGNAYYIRDIQYFVEIPEYKRIIVNGQKDRLLNPGDKYNAETLLEERDRMVSDIRDHGYYYVSNDIISFQIDTLESGKHLDKNGNKTLVINVFVNFNRISDSEIQEKHAYKFYFNKVYIYPNYSADTSHLIVNNFHRSKDDHTPYTIISVNREAWPKHAIDKPLRDIRPRILVDNILTKQGELYSQSLVTRSRKKLSDLKNFSYLDIVVEEDEAKRDSATKTGLLNTYYYLKRSKLHSLSVEFEARSDKTDLSLTYSNKNIFRSAEFFNVNVYGGLGFQIRAKKADQPAAFTLESKEVGAELSLDFRRLLFFRKTQKIDALNYGTSLKLGAHYENNYLFNRGLYNAALVYSLAYTSNLTHTITPIDLSVIDITPKGEEFYDVMALYSKDFRAKYQDNFLLSLKYALTYTHPFDDIRNSLIIRLKMESSGMLLAGICAMAKAPKDENGHYMLGSRNFGNFELGEIDLRYTYTINKNNSLATRFNFGVGLPLWNATTLPFEKSFSLGGSNSMRAWDYRRLGPGSYYNEANEDLVQDIRTGDVKLEMNLEYRGTLYKFIKYGVFADMGNIWLAHKDEDMPNAEFQFNRFYKEIGLGVGAGIRLDFSFFIIRVDAAVAIYDPCKAPGDKWIGLTTNDLGKKSLNRSVNILFGIGHAF